MIMSVDVILKNVYTFLDILKSALSDDINTWDNEVVDNAVRWAKYCSQLYHQAQGKPYQNELDHQIQELGKLPWFLGNLQINLKLIGQAENLIKEALLQNPTLPNDSFEYIISLYQLESAEGKNDFIETCHQMTVNRSVLNIITSLNTSLLNENCDPSLKSSVTVAAQAQLLFKFLQDILQKVPVNKKDRTESFLKRTMSQFAIKPGAMPVLVAALKMVHLTDKDMENCVKTLLLHTVLNLPLKYKLQFKSLMTGSSTVGYLDDS